MAYDGVEDYLKDVPKMDEPRRKMGCSPNPNASQYEGLTKVGEIWQVQISKIRNVGT